MALIYEIQGAKDEGINMDEGESGQWNSGAVRTLEAIFSGILKKE